MAVAISPTYASWKKEKSMYEDTLAGFMKYCEEEEDFCVICFSKNSHVKVENNCCQRCEDNLVAAIEND